MRPGPLEVLGARLLARAAPPSIPELVSLVACGEDYRDFRIMVKEFLPEEEANIMHATGAPDRIRLFALAFERRYFPLWPFFTEGEATDYCELTRFMPVDVHGLSWDDWGELASDYYRPSFRLAAYLTDSPYQEGAGFRLALADSLSSGVDASVLARVPEPFSREELHRMLDGSQYAGLAVLADLFWQDTDNPFLDNSQESVYDGCADLQWTRENVEVLSKAYLEYQVLGGSMQEFCSLMEAGEGGELVSYKVEELFDYIASRGGKIGAATARSAALGLDPPGFVASRPLQTWLVNLVDNLSVGGCWVAPVGFTFDKVAARHIRLRTFTDSPEIREMLHNTEILGREVGVRVDTEALG